MEENLPDWFESSFGPNFPTQMRVQFRTGMMEMKALKKFLENPLPHSSEPKSNTVILFSFLIQHPYWFPLFLSSWQLYSLCWPPAIINFCYLWLMFILCEKTLCHKPIKSDLLLTESHAEDYHWIPALLLFAFVYLCMEADFYGAHSHSVYFRVSVHPPLPAMGNGRAFKSSKAAGRRAVVCSAPGWPSLNRMSGCVMEAIVSYKHLAPGQ